MREEWDSAALQNANTKCNGLLPLWGPQVPESGFAACLARYILEYSVYICLFFPVTLLSCKCETQNMSL